MEPVYLVLENGMAFAGHPIGAWKETDPGLETVGELVFTTGVVGYLETLTDPSYAGQIITQTFPLIGNYGVIPSDFEGTCAARGYVVRELCAEPSNFRSEYALDRFLAEQGIVGICGVDTRALTRVLRTEGVMNAAICGEVPDDLSEIRSWPLRDTVASVSTKAAFEVPAEGTERFHVALIDYGVKRSIIRALTRRDCRVTVLPHNTSAEEVLALAPDGVMLSNGPGDPAENVYEIAQIRELIGRVPIFGVCLGHQLTALAMGGQTVKLKFGHRGGNQPVKRLADSRTFITSQNHGYAVLADSVAGAGAESWRNANDGSCEGIDYPGRSCFTVQFHPEAHGGPQDTGFLFDRFRAMMGGEPDA